MKKTSEPNLMELLTAEDKIALQTGSGCWNTASVEKLNIRSVTVADGPVGLRKEENGETLPAVAFPCAAKTACGFDVDLMRKVGAALGEQCRAANVDVILGPGVNIKRDPRCGRNFEYFSEDPLLTADLACAYVEGVHSQQTGVCVKHFAANNQEYGRLVCDSVIDDRALREIYLSAFEKIVKRTNPCAVMCAYNKLNGEYCSENKKLLTDLLRGEWGYDGLVMSDWGAVNDRVKGISSGLDLEMPQGDVTKIRQALEQGRLNMSDLDAAAQRVIDLSKKFDGNASRNVDFEAQHELARKASSDCIVLVKNNCNMLPLSKTDKVAVIGALAETPTFQGLGSSQVRPYRVDSLLSAFKQSDIDYVYAKGYDTNGMTNEALLDEASSAALSCDKTVVIVGAAPDTEGRDRDCWKLPDNQLELIDAVTSASSNVVIALQCGSSLDTSFVHSAKAILIDYYGGESGGQALFDVLYGDASPKGRLAETWYSDLPDFCGEYDKDYRRALYKESIYVGYRFTTKANASVAFPFGYGLTYNSIKWGEPSISHRDKTKIVVNVQVINTGATPDAEVVQVYATNVDGRGFYEGKKLVGFVKVHLKPREKRVATVTVPTEELAHFDVSKGRFSVNGGKYIITVGRDCNDDRYRFEYTVSGENDTVDESDKYGCYYDVSQSFNPSDDEFYALLGRDVDQPSSEINVSTALGDVGESIVAKILKKLLTKSLDDIAKRYALATPLRSFVSKSLTTDMLYTLIDMLNGNVFKNLLTLFKQYLGARKAAKKKGESK